jgi:hypothetical protein
MPRHLGLFALDERPAQARQEVVSSSDSPCGALSPEHRNQAPVQGGGEPLMRARRRSERWRGARTVIESGRAELAREPLGVVAELHRTTMPSSRLAERAEEWRTKAPPGLPENRRRHPSMVEPPVTVGAVVSTCKPPISRSLRGASAPLSCAA